MDHKDWHSRGYLPHCDFADSIQGITFRLADSMPNDVIDGWRKQLKDDGIHGRPAETALYRKISKYEDAGYGDCILRRAECADVVQAQLKKHHGERYRLLEWCIMPNHVHVLFRLEGEAVLADIVQAWKGGSAVEINRLLGRSGPLWQRDYYDRSVRDMDHFHDCRIYIRNNPVKAGLYEKPEDWKFSSAGCGWTPDGAPASAGLEDSANEDAG